jgi:gas vesicle protein
MKESNTLLAFAAGAAAGAVLGILFAPDKGSETRRKIASRAKDLSDGITDKYNDLIEWKDSLIEEGVSDLENGLAAGTNSVRKSVNGINKGSSRNA